MSKKVKDFVDAQTVPMPVPDVALDPVVYDVFGWRHPLARRVQTQVVTESKVQSEFAAEADANYIIDKHIRAGDHGRHFELDHFQDVSDLPDFQTAQNTIIAAQDAWMGLDAKIRRAFGDNIERFLKALKDPAQHDHLVSLNVFKPKSGLNTPPAVEPAKAPQGVQGGNSEAVGGSKTPQAQ